MTSQFYRKQRPWSMEAARMLLNMSGGIPAFETIGEKQLTAAVALQRMLLDHGIAYLADEVGMGKTYVALAVVALMRHLQPDFKVLYLVPSRNVQIKWHERELPAFLRSHVNIAVTTHATKPAISCDSVEQWAKLACSHPKVLDTFLRFSALSFDLGDEEDGRKRVSELAAVLGLDPTLGNMKYKEAFKQRAASLVNQVLPCYDLVIVGTAATCVSCRP